MSTPKRIQRKRTKGWKMPEGAVYVGRPTVFGNPAIIEKNRDRFAVWGGDVGPRIGTATTMQYARWLAVGHFRVWLTSPEGVVTVTDFGNVERPSYAYCDDHRQLHARLHELHGRDLACWCPLDQPCHADVLLEIANGGDDS
jgi:hypothetical protein